jgi:hypothetical protein
VCRGETRATEWKRLHNVSRCDVLLTIVVYIRGGVLFGVPFDPVRLEIRGTPTHLLDTWPPIRGLLPVVSISREQVRSFTRAVLA